MWWCCCDAPPGHPMPGCLCDSVPDALFFHCDAGSGPFNILFPCAISYGPRPADLAGYSSDLVGWYGTRLVSGGGINIRYWWLCSLGQYGVQYLITNDDPSYPGSGLVCSVAVGAVPGNTCSPFSMTVIQDNTGHNTRHIRIDAAGPP